jgi:hypothetical protein
LTLTGTLAGAQQASAVAAAASACKGWQATQPPDPGSATDDLFGVAVLSPSNAWAVGDYSSQQGGTGPFRTLIEHWNGHAWKQVPSPNPGRGSNYLGAVDAVSASSIWAVGEYSSQHGGVAPDKTMLLHWNGHTWKQVPSPSPGSQLDEASGVDAVSASSAWVVGDYAGSNFRDKSLILHWDGHAWKQAPSPNPGTMSDVLVGVDATSGSTAWAVGNARSGSTTPSRPLVARWNGHAWKQVPSPNPTGGGDLLSVSATSASNAWAVGVDSKGRSLTLRWNGKTWARVASPNILGNGDDNTLESVAATSKSNAWAVGQATVISTGTAFELHWNGHKWSNMVSPTPGDTSAMFAVAASSASNAWAVGEFTRDPSGTAHRTLAFHC